MRRREPTKPQPRQSQHASSFPGETTWALKCNRSKARGTLGGAGLSLTHAWRTVQHAAAAFVPLSADAGMHADTARCDTHRNSIVQEVGGTMGARTGAEY